MITQTGIKRLRKLALFLITEVPVANFDMEYLVVKPKKNSCSKRLKASCGTSGCALGWATTVFPRDLKISTYDIFSLDDGRFEYDVVHNKSGERSLMAAQVFFELKCDEVEYLFGADNKGKTPSQIGVRMLRFCRKKERLLAKLKRVKKMVKA